MICLQGNAAIDLSLAMKASFRYEMYLKSGCLDMETYGIQESLKKDNISIEEEMENIDALKLGKTDTEKRKAPAITDESREKSTEEEKKEEKQEKQESSVEETEIIKGSASSSVNIDAEDSTRQGTKRISVRSTQQNFFSIETFSPRYSN